MKFLSEIFSRISERSQQRWSLALKDQKEQPFSLRQSPEHISELPTSTSKIMVPGVFLASLIQLPENINLDGLVDPSAIWCSTNLKQDNQRVMVDPKLMIVCLHSR